jgi:hypothetical protein
MNQIQAQGSQAAYDQAANQFRQGVTQDVAINQLQNQYGGQQQAQAQKGLDVGYQDFLNQQNYPYKQIGFMSDLVRGLPLGQQSTAAMYQAPPSTLQTVGALGMGAYGAKQMGMFADGGQVDSYAGGGEINAMNDQNQMADAVDKLTDEQLQQIIQNPSSAAELEAAKMELATRASERSGLAGAYNMQNQAPEAPSMAHGGMVAFAHGGIPRYDAGGETTEGESAASLNQMASNYDSEANEDMDGGADGTTYDKEIPENKTLLQEYMNMLRDNKARTGVKLRNDAEMEAATVGRLGRLERTLGGNQMYTDIEGQISKMRGENEGALSEGKGLAALQAAGAMLQGNDPMRGLGAAGSAFASSYAPALAAKRKSDQAFTEMNINLSKARRAEKMGLLKEADQFEQNAEKNKIAAYNADTTARRMGLTSIPALLKATRVNVPKPAAIPKESDMVIYANATPEKQAQMRAFHDSKGNTAMLAAFAAIGGRTAVADQGNVVDWAAKVADFTGKAQKAIGERRDGDAKLRKQMRDDPTLESRLVNEEVTRMIQQAQGTAATTKIGGGGGEAGGGKSKVIKLD